MVRHLFFAFSLVIAFLGVTSNEAAHACSPLPGGPPTLRQNIESADAIFTGRITSVFEDGVSIKVSRVFKGLVVTEVFARIAPSNSLCGLDGMKKGETIVVFAQDKVLSENLLCGAAGRTFTSSQLEGAHLGAVTKAEARLLGKGHRPREERLHILG